MIHRMCETCDGKHLIGKMCGCDGNYDDSCYHKIIKNQTNANRIRTELQDDRKLAEVLIKHEHEADYDYNYEEELEYWGEIDYYITPNGERLSDFEEAVSETLDWLKQEVD